MTSSTDQSVADQALIERWRDEPAPLLPLLHAFHDRDGFLSDDAIRAVSAGLKIPLADLYGTVTFYHHFFQRFPPGKVQRTPRVRPGRSAGCWAARSSSRSPPQGRRHAHALRRSLRRARSR